MIQYIACWLRHNAATTLVVVTTLTLALPAKATILNTTGSISLITPPASVAANVLESDTLVRAFAEQVNLTLSQVAPIDVNAPGTYSPGGPNLIGSFNLPVGLVVNSYYLHFDPTAVGGGYFGTVTFDSPVVGIAGLAATLDASDFAGSPLTTYPTGFGGRGFDFPPGPLMGDTLVLSPDRLTITISGGAFGAQDQLRVFTSPVPESGSALLLVVAVSLMLGKRAAQSWRNG